MGLKDREAIFLLHYGVKALVSLNIRRIGQDQKITGRVVVKHKTAHGTMFLIENKYPWDYRNGRSPHPASEAFGWDYIPVWVSECGQSGVPSDVSREHPAGDPDYDTALMLLDCVHWEEDMEKSLALEAKVEAKVEAKAVESERLKRESIGVLAGAFLRWLAS